LFFETENLAIRHYTNGEMGEMFGISYTAVRQKVTVLFHLKRGAIVGKVRRLTGWAPAFCCVTGVLLSWE